MYLNVIVNHIWQVFSRFFNMTFLLSTFFAILSVCNCLSSPFNVCLMHGKIQQACMKTVIVPTYVSDVGSYRRPVSLATIISKIV